MEMPDLRERYGYENNTEDLINNLVQTNQRSKVQEQHAYDYLQTVFQKVAKQKTITYKLQGQKEKFCIPDFICGLPDRVVIVDAKLDYTNDDKMDLYISLVQFILKANGDQRPVSGAHIMYDERVKELGKYAYAHTKYDIIQIKKICA